MQEMEEIQQERPLLLLEGEEAQKEAGLEEQVGTHLPPEREEEVLLELMQVTLTMTGMGGKAVVQDLKQQAVNIWSRLLSH
jgi:hypothetical protein